MHTKDHNLHVLDQNNYHVVLPGDCKILEEVSSHRKKRIGEHLERSWISQVPNT